MTRRKPNIIVSEPQKNLGFDSVETRIAMSLVACPTFLYSMVSLVSLKPDFYDETISVAKRDLLRLAREIRDELNGLDLEP